MGASGPLPEKAARPRGLSRRQALLLGLLVALVTYPALVGVLPWALSLLAPRFGWSADGPATWNLLGLVPVAVGVAGLAWVFRVLLLQLPRLPDWIELGPGEHLATATARVLVTHGPFALSRNPMFLSGLTTMLGWAIFYGSWVILALTIAGWCFSNFVKVPQEERALEARFGEEYRRYRQRVPRWLGPLRR